MTEAEWLDSTDPIAMVEFLRETSVPGDTVNWRRSDWRFDEPQDPTDRKFRRFACACCRRIWDRIPEKCNRDAVAAVEDYLDGLLGGPAVQEAMIASSAVEWKEDGSGRRSEPGYWAVKYLGRGFYKLTAGRSALFIAFQIVFMADEEYKTLAGEEYFARIHAAGEFQHPFQWPLPVPAPVVAERVALSGLLRCLFGNPFRPVALDLRWRSADVMALAQGIESDQAWDRLPILADALMDAGCDSEEILAHCRSEATHVKGCWAVDLVLGKE